MHHTKIISNDHSTKVKRIKSNKFANQCHNRQLELHNKMKSNSSTKQTNQHAMKKNSSTKKTYVKTMKTNSSALRINLSVMNSNSLATTANSSTMKTNNSESDLVLDLSMKSRSSDNLSVASERHVTFRHLIERQIKMRENMNDVTKAQIRENMNDVTKTQIRENMNDVTKTKTVSSQMDYEEAMINGFVPEFNHISSRSHESGMPFSMPTMKQFDTLGSYPDLKNQIRSDGKQFGTRANRDKLKALKMGITFSMSEIIHLPFEQFNVLLSRGDLSEAQIQLCRDIRKRGRNKEAARICRNRKLELISNLEDELTRTRQYKSQLMDENHKLNMLTHQWSEELRKLEEDVISGLCIDSLGMDPHQFTLQMTRDGLTFTLAKKHSE